MSKFRYSLNGGASWTVINAALPYNIPSALSDDVIVEPIGAAVTDLGEAPTVTYLPTISTPYAYVTGLHKLIAGYSGPLATVCATNAADAPASTIDVYPNADGTPNLTAATTAFGASFDVYKTYDQTGSKPAAITATASQRFTISATAHGPFRGFYGGKVLGNSYGAANWLALPAALAVDAANVAYLAVLAGAGQGNANNVLLQLGTEDFLTGVTLYEREQGWRSDGAQAMNAGLAVDMNPCVVGLRSAVASQKFYRNEQTATGTAKASASISGGNIGNFGNFGYGSGESSNLFRFGDVVFATNPSDADWAAVQSALKARFAIPVRTSQVIDTGDSITAGLGQSSGVTVSGRPRSYYERGRLTRDPYILNMGKGGSLTVNWASTLNPSVFADLFQAGFVRNVFRHGAGRNDLAGGQSAANVIAAWTTIISRAKAAGFSVSMRTIMVSASVDETDRNTCNNWLRTNAASMGFVVEDMDTIASAPTWADGGIHPDDATYSRMADVSVPVINGLLA